MSDRKICYEELLDNFKEAAQKWLEAVPEARGLMLVVDWKTGKNDFPPCSIVCQPADEFSLIDMMKQSVKLTEHLCMLFTQQANRVGSILEQTVKVTEN